jgi:hypothetical protein
MIWFLILSKKINLHILLAPLLQSSIYQNLGLKFKTQTNLHFQNGLKNFSVRTLIINH